MDEMKGTRVAPYNYYGIPRSQQPAEPEFGQGGTSTRKYQAGVRYTVCAKDQRTFPINFRKNNGVHCTQCSHKIDAELGFGSQWEAARVAILAGVSVEEYVRKEVESRTGRATGPGGKPKASERIEVERLAAKCPPSVSDPPTARSHAYPKANIYGTTLAPEGSTATPTPAPVPAAVNTVIFPTLHKRSYSAFGDVRGLEKPAVKEPALKRARRSAHTARNHPTAARHEQPTGTVMPDGYILGEEGTNGAPPGYAPVLGFDPSGQLFGHKYVSPESHRFNEVYQTMQISRDMLRWVVIR
ncbi:hypothetical protein LTR36_005478 [Oleoguttula mirabilis]|uniref:Uncharacterized protein n=1 Tax=Oleoguttula mirabilis TaxID=1507867 RepID=A0AAV9JFA2_9PEZI|nr:hypothetical protein LTR36_005478 [Oleoguttula mirabilis]